MRKTVNGVTYDSDCGYTIGSLETECYPFNTTSWAIEWLIRTPDGKFFLYHEWTATSKRGLQEGAGEDITPINSADEARTWLKTNCENLSDSKIDEMLNPLLWDVPNAGRRKVAVVLSNEVLEKLIELSAGEGNTISYIIDDALHEYFKMQRS